MDLRCYDETKDNFASRSKQKIFEQLLQLRCFQAAMKYSDWNQLYIIVIVEHTK